MLSEESFEAYVSPLAEEQRKSIASVRALIQEYTPDLVETIDEGKWFGGLLTYHSEDGVFMYALGPRKDGSTTLHMMSYYSSPALQAAYGDALKKFFTGKSCIKFKRFDLLPEEAIRGIFAAGPRALESLRAFMAARKQR